MNLISKYFDELTTRELYEILKVRTKIFVVEQNCPYLEPDGMDYESLHVFYEKDGQVLAYLRAFRKDEETVQMGRVLSAEHGKSYGGKILADGLALCVEILHCFANKFSISYINHEDGTCGQISGEDSFGD